MRKRSTDRSTGHIPSFGFASLTPGKKVNPSFLYNRTRHMYEEAGFTYDRPKGKNHCVMTRVVDPVS